MQRRACRFRKFLASALGTIDNAMTQNRNSDAPPGENVNAADWLVGGGEMGTLIRSMDWSSTALGPIGEWPQSLRTTAGLCLSSNLPIAIAWGPGHTWLYNDAYLPNCAEQHPHSMGMDFSACRASAFPAIGDAFRSALAGTAAFLEDQRMFLDRMGYLEETFHTFSFSPIRDETGQVAGLFHPVTETTAKMLAQRHARALRGVAACNGNARALEASIADMLHALAQCELDLPFALFYRLDAQRRCAHLAGATGLLAGTRACPSRVDLSHATAAWPLAEAAASGQPVYVDDLRQRFPDLICAPYPEALKAAFVMPIGSTGTGQPLCLMVVGASTRLPMNESYRAFFELLTATVSTVLSSAVACEAGRERTEPLAPIDRARSRFLAAASHDLRQPLSALGIYANVLKNHVAPAGQPLLASLKDCIGSMSALLADLLDLSKLAAGVVTPQPDHFPLAEVLASQVAIHAPEAQLKGLRLRCAATGLMLFSDPVLFARILGNLIDNAVRYTDSGGVLVACRRRQGKTWVEVRDSGIGIADKMTAEIFEKFKQIDDGHKRGSGLGLAIVARSAALLGLEITVRSWPGRGSVFALELPLGPARTLPAQPASPGPVPAAAHRAGG